MSSAQTTNPEAGHIDVSILIASYNTRELTLACLDSIARETRALGYEVVIVDNASTDGSAEAIAQHPLGARLIASPVNLGFARANNLAASFARGEFVLLLNPDTVVLDRAIEKLVATARENRAAGIWGGRTVFADGRLNPSSCWGRMTLWNLFCRAAGLTGLFPKSALFNGEGYGGWARDAAREVDIVSGCFLLMSRSDWNALGGFDPAYFMYGEDADLCLRARAAGARPMITPEATIVHLGGASETVRSAKMIRLLTAKAMLIRRHFPSWTQSLGLALLAAWPLSRAIACRSAALATGRERFAVAADMWGEVWRARRDWLPGYVTEVAGQPPAQPIAATDVVVVPDAR